MKGPLCSFGAPGEIRTPDRLVRSQVLYPAELRALCLAWGRSSRRGAHLTDLGPSGKGVFRA